MHIPAGSDDCFLVGAMVRICPETLASTAHHKLHLSPVRTLGVCCANVGLRRIEAGTRARATLLNITNKCVGGSSGKGRGNDDAISSFKHLGEKSTRWVSALRYA
jgi:hypothetical protein